MIASLTRDTRKKLRYAISFLTRRLVHVNLQVLYVCNYRCRICDFWKAEFRRRPLMAVADAEVISEKLNRIGPQIISIGGGEPLLHPHLVDIVRVLSRHHFPVMITNGSLITPQNAQALFGAGMAEISVSVDYAEAARHDTQRGIPGAFDQAVEALRVLHASRTHPEQRVHMISVIMDDNLAEVEPLLHLCQRLGITYLVTLYSHGRGDKLRRLISDGVSQHLLQLKRQHRHFVALRGYLARFSAAVRQGGIGPCYAGRNLCNIDSAGNVSFCIDRLDDPVENILRDDILGIVQRLRARQRTNDCRACWTSCRGSIEALMYGRQPWLSLLDYWRMTRPVALRGTF
jgi:MoaA/NifB/PqqE/SkfB family radical SAM enzyme